MRGRLVPARYVPHSLVQACVVAASVPFWRIGGDELVLREGSTRVLLDLSEAGLIRGTQLGRALPHTTL